MLLHKNQILSSTTRAHARMRTRTNVTSRPSAPRTQEPRMRTTFGRFTTDVENFHGRIAMIGITGCAVDETFAKLPIVQQFVTETGVSSIALLAFVTVVTSAFILETLNPTTIKREEPELEIFSKPGFTLETEILHGRIAMLAFAYAVLSEQLYSALIL